MRGWRGLRRVPTRALEKSNSDYSQWSRIILHAQLSCHGACPPMFLWSAHNWFHWLKMDKLRRAVFCLRSWSESDTLTLIDGCPVSHTAEPPCQADVQRDKNSFGSIWGRKTNFIHNVINASGPFNPSEQSRTGGHMWRLENEAYIFCWKVWGWEPNTCFQRSKSKTFALKTWATRSWNRGWGCNVGADLRKLVWLAHQQVLHFVPLSSASLRFYSFSPPSSTPPFLN